MRHIRGAAIKVKAEASVVTGTTMLLEKLIDPTGEEILTNEAMTFGSGDDASIASVVWQSLSSSELGRYKYIIKATNGGYSSIGRGYFYLEAY